MDQSAVSMENTTEATVSELQVRLDASERQLETLSLLVAQEEKTLAALEQRATVVVDDWSILDACRTLLAAVQEDQPKFTATPTDMAEIATAVDEFDAVVGRGEWEALPHAKLLCTLPDCVYAVNVDPVVPDNTARRLEHDDTASIDELSAMVRGDRGSSTAGGSEERLDAETKCLQVSQFRATVAASQEQLDVLTTLSEHEQASVEKVKRLLADVNPESGDKPRLGLHRGRSTAGSTATSHSAGRRRPATVEAAQALSRVSAPIRPYADGKPNVVVADGRQLQPVDEPTVPIMHRAFRLLGVPVATSAAAGRESEDPSAPRYLPPDRWVDALRVAEKLRSQCAARAAATAFTPLLEAIPQSPTSDDAAPLATEHSTLSDMIDARKEMKKVRQLQDMVDELAFAISRASGSTARSTGSPRQRSMASSLRRDRSLQRTSSAASKNPLLAHAASEAKEAVAASEREAAVYVEAAVGLAAGSVAIVQGRGDESTSTQASPNHRHASRVAEEEGKQPSQQQQGDASPQNATEAPVPTDADVSHASSTDTLERLVEVERENEILREKLHDAEHELNIARQNVSNQTEAMLEASEKAQFVTAERDDLQARLNASDTLLEEAKGAVANLHDEVRALRDERDAEQLRLVEELDEEREHRRRLEQALVAEDDIGGSRVAAAAAAGRSASPGGASHHSGTKRATEELSRELHESRAAEDALRSELAQLRHDYDRLELRATRDSVAAQELKQRIENVLLPDYRRLKDSIARGFHDAAATNALLRTELEEADQRYNDREAVREQEARELQATIEGLEDQLADTQRRCDEAVARLDAARRGSTTSSTGPATRRVASAGASRRAPGTAIPGYGAPGGEEPALRGSLSRTGSQLSNTASTTRSSTRPSTGGGAARQQPTSRSQFQPNYFRRADPNGAPPLPGAATRGAATTRARVPAAGAAALLPAPETTTETMLWDESTEGASNLNRAESALIPTMVLDHQHTVALLKQWKQDDTSSRRR